MNGKRHESGKWFPTADGIDWGDAGQIELKMADGTVVLATLEVEEQFTGEDEIPAPNVKLHDGQVISFFDFEEWRHASK